MSQSFRSVKQSSESECNSKRSIAVSAKCRSRTRSSSDCDASPALSAAPVHTHWVSLGVLELVLIVVLLPFGVMTFQALCKIQWLSGVLLSVMVVLSVELVAVTTLVHFSERIVNGVHPDPSTDIPHLATEKSESREMSPVMLSDFQCSPGAAVAPPEASSSLTMQFRNKFQLISYNIRLWSESHRPLLATLCCVCAYSILFIPVCSSLVVMFLSMIVFPNHAQWFSSISSVSWLISTASRSSFGEDGFGLSLLLLQAVIMQVLPVFLSLLFPELPAWVAVTQMLLSWIVLSLFACLFGAYVLLLYVAVLCVGSIRAFFFVKSLQSRCDELQLESGHSRESSGHSAETGTSCSSNKVDSNARHMIANVAHDLKTPLASFAAGIELINHDLRRIGTYDLSTMKTSDVVDVQLSLASIRMNLVDIKDTNLFMLMSIHRCIDVTKSSTGLKLVPRYESFSLLDAIQLPLRCVRNIQQRVDVKLNDLPPDLCSCISTDRQWLQENVLCLLSNAVKYSVGGLTTVTIALDDSLHCRNGRARASSWMQSAPSTSAKSSHLSCGPVKLSSVSNATVVNGFVSKLFMINSTDKPRYIRIEVEDNGIGMTDKAMENLFTPFKQTQRLAGGTGLGLYSLSRRIEALKGRCGVHKRADGQQGSVFWFSFPYQPDEALAEGLRNSRRSAPLSFRSNVSSTGTRNNSLRRPYNTMAHVSSNSHLRVLNAPQNKTFFREDLPSKSSSSPVVKSCNILLVDDSPPILKMTKLLLQRLGHRVTTAENGQAAIDAVVDRWQQHQQRFDIVLMDLQMPVMDGLETTRRLMALKDVPSQCVVCVSANVDEEIMTEAEECGFTGFLPKPFDSESFNKLCASLLIAQSPTCSAPAPAPVVSDSEPVISSEQ